MNESAQVRASKRLSRYLRHQPELIGLTLGDEGWIAVTELLAALARHGHPLSRAELDEIVASSDKQRFAFDATGSRIRANQGHSVPVALNLPTATPPTVLYHGTVAEFLPAIRRDGLLPMSRHAVHLSARLDTATAVGARRGRPVVLRVAAKAMTEAGHEFQLSANGVWLTAHVPARYLTVPAH